MQNIQYMTNMDTTTCDTTEIDLIGTKNTEYECIIYYEYGNDYLMKKDTMVIDLIKMKKIEIDTKNIIEQDHDLTKIK